MKIAQKLRILQESYQAPDHEIIRISEAHILPTIRITHIIVQKSTVFQSEAIFHPEFALKIFEILIICLSVCQSRPKE